MLHLPLRPRQHLELSFSWECLELSFSWDGALSFHSVPSPCSFQRGWGSKLHFGGSHPRKWPSLILS